MPIAVIEKFEEQVAAYTGAPFAIATDSGTSAIFLCCRYHEVDQVTIPRRTHISVPSAIVHAGGEPRFANKKWTGVYPLLPYPIWDAACRFTKGMYSRGTFMCLSFDWKKHVPIGRGGMILTDDAKAARWFRMARAFGLSDYAHPEEGPQMVGWRCYMNAEEAARGLLIMRGIKDNNADLSFPYPDLAQFPVFASGRPSGTRRAVWDSPCQ